MSQPTNSGQRYPGAVLGAFVIFLVAAVVALLNAYFSFNSSVWDEAVAAARTSGVSISTSSIKIFALLSGLIVAGLYLLFAFKMRAGRNWARIVLTVVTALAVVGSTARRNSVAVGGHSYTVSSSLAVGLFGGIIAVIAVVLMFLPSSNAYFSSAKAARTAAPGY